MDVCTAVADWCLPAKERNRRAHAMNGNTPGLIFYGDSSCYCKTEKRVRKEYGEIKQGSLYYSTPAITCQAGACVRDVTKMIWDGPFVETIVVSILGNDFIDANWSVISDYPAGLDDDLRLLVTALRARSNCCSFLLFGEAARCGYPARYDGFATRARETVARATGYSGVVYDLSLIHI